MPGRLRKAKESVGHGEWLGYLSTPKRNRRAKIGWPDPALACDNQANVLREGETMARGRHSSLSITLTEEEQQELEHWVRSSTMPAGKVRRARIILLVAQGLTLSQVARTVGIRRRFVYKWADRFRKHRLDGLDDKSGRGRKPAFSP